MKRLFILPAFIFISIVSSAQQDPQFSQNMFTRLYVNPAFAGTSDAICASLMYRNQWTNFDGAPKTFLFQADAPIGKSLGLGLSVAADELGFENTIQPKLAVAYHFNLGASKLGIGADLGMIQREIDGDFVFNDANDPSIPTSAVSDNIFPDIGAGIYFNSDKAYLGVSASHLTEGELDYGDFKSVSVRHYYFTGGYSFDLTPNWALKPSVLVKNDGNITQADFNLNVHYANRVWIGGSYRLEDAIVAMLGINITQNLRIGYSFDITTSEIKDFSSGTHEVMLGYCFRVSKKTLPMIRNVRFL